MRLEGTVCPMPTPTTGRDIDTDALAEYTSYLINGGVHGLFPCGSIGEFPSLTRAQRSNVLETVVDSADDVPVLAGCGHTSAGDVAEHIRDADAAGVDAAVVVTPYYLSTTQDGLQRFFETIADDSSLPIVLYNIPALTGEELSVDLVSTMAEHPNVVGLKDTSGDLTFLYDVIETTPSDFDVFQGASSCHSIARTRCKRVDRWASKRLPRPVAQLYDSYRHSDYDHARQLMNSVVNPVVSTMNDIPTAAAMKHLVRRSGIDIGTPLPPLPQLDDAQRERLDHCYDSVLASVTV
ncbi:dihydrodipicolinate synthase family protein [Natronoarchaeum sp. GCM10025703]|uniref:dihydrodipicolinate synthase family protein n=1 Tax=Natronoarchaeum sp. GCM10025703 TaxID=3252685 RepID=UPI003611F7CD